MNFSHELIYGNSVGNVLVEILSVASMIPPQLIIPLNEPFGGSLTEIIVIECGLDHIVKQ